MNLRLTSLRATLALHGSQRYRQLLSAVEGAYPALSGDQGHAANATTLLVAVDAAGTTLLGYPGWSGLPSIALRSDTHAAWHRAHTLAARMTLSSIPDEALSFHPTAVVLDRTGASDAPRHFEGVSFGAAFFLAEYARLGALKVPSDLVVLATLEPDGRLGPVESLNEKFEALREVAHGVRRVVVSRAQGPSEPVAGVDLVVCSDAAELVALAFSEQVVRSIAARPATMNAVVERLFFDTFNTTDRHVVWRMVKDITAELSAHPAMAPETRDRLRFVRAVALRRGSQQPEPGMPEWSTALVEASPPEIGRLVAAHLVQQSVWSSDLEERRFVRDMAESLVAAQPARDCSPNELRLRGALARLDLREGREDRAFEANREIGLGWLDLAPEEASFPISQLYVAAAVGTPDQFEARMKQADGLRTRWTESSGASAAGRAHIALQRARSLCLQGKEQRIAPAELEAIRSSPLLDPAVRLRAAFFLAVVVPNHRDIWLAWMQEQAVHHSPSLDALLAAVEVWSTAARSDCEALLPRLSHSLRAWLAQREGRSLRWVLATAQTEF